MIQTPLHTPKAVFEPIPNSYPPAFHTRTSPPSSLLPYLSSPEVGWGGLVAKAVHEVREMEGWMLPAHSDISLTLFTGGAMHVEWREVHAHGSWRGLDVRAGDLVLRVGHPPYELRWRSLSTVPTLTFNLHLRWDVLARTVEAVSGRDASRLTLVERAGFQDPLLTQLALALWRELYEGAPTGKLFAQSAAQLLALHLLRQYSAPGTGKAVTQAPTQTTQTLTLQQLQRVVAYIRDESCQDLTLDGLAQQVGFSPHHFGRLFRQATGESPHQFVLRERLARARRLLEAKEVRLAQVAVECGFADQSSFTRAFKRVLGVTPSAYRREHAH